MVYDWDITHLDDWENFQPPSSDAGKRCVYLDIAMQDG